MTKWKRSIALSAILRELVIEEVVREPYEMSLEQNYKAQLMRKGGWALQGWVEDVKEDVTVTMVPGSLKLQTK